MDKWNINEWKGAVVSGNEQCLFMWDPHFNITAWADRWCFKTSLIQSVWNQQICFKLWSKITLFLGFKCIIVQWTYLNDWAHKTGIMERKPEKREYHGIYMQGHTDIQWDTSPHQWWNTKMYCMQCDRWSEGREWKLLQCVYRGSWYGPLFTTQKIC